MWTDGRAQGCACHASQAHTPRQISDRGLLKHGTNSDFGVQCAADAADQARCQQRVAPQCEKVFVDVDPVPAEHLGKESGKDFLLWSARCSSCYTREIRFG